MIIACLHTAESNIAIFDAERPEGVDLRHTVRADLLAAADKGLTPEVTSVARHSLMKAAAGADAALLTCSTLGPVTDGLEADIPVLRVDAALAEAACAPGGDVAVICAAPSTLAPTRALFQAEAAKTGANVRIMLVEGAWETFLSGDQDAYLRAIANVADRAGADVVALAQASMAPAAAMTRREVLTSPKAALRAVLTAVR